MNNERPAWPSSYRDHHPYIPERTTEAMTRKAVFLDVDGTLIDDYGRVPESAVLAVREARTNGHLVFLCTGRSMVELTSSVHEVEVDGFVLSSGAYVQVGSEVLKHERLSQAAVRHVADFFDAHGGGYFFQAYDAVYASPESRDLLRSIVSASVASDPAFSEVDHGLLTYVDTITVDADPRAMVMTKAIFFESVVSVDDLRTEFPEFLIVPASVTVLGTNAGEMTIPGIHKATGIDVVLDRVGIDLADTIAIGDSYNDLEMLEHVAVGIAMGDAPQAVRDVADEVTASTTEDGVHLAFLRHGLIAG
jgi:Cof subfamily protein (haloacid dehalogenase superfamily)